MSTSLLEVERINTFYGDSHILFDVSLHVKQHEVVALLGRNGAGKTTTLRTIMGVLAPRRGRCGLTGKPIEALPPYAIARMGMQLVPEERAIFGQLTVEENLRLAALTAPNAWSLDRVYDFSLGCGSAGGPAGGNCQAASSRCWRSPGR